MKYLIASIVLSIACSGCGRDVTDALIPLDRAPAEVRAFVLSQPLTPPIQGYQVILDDAADDFLLFSVASGPPQDCPSGCFYLGGWGVRYHGRIGWIQVLEDLEWRKRFVAFDVLPGETFLYSLRLLSAIRARNENSYFVYSTFLKSDPDVPN